MAPGLTGSGAGESAPIARRPPPPGSRLALFATCVVDLVSPGVGKAAVRLLEAAGYEVTFPQAQACCGQPAYSAGEMKAARRLARATIDAFTSAESVIAPSGSCVAMLRITYPRLFAGSPLEDAADSLAARTWELTELLALAPPAFGGQDMGKVTLHDACHGLRELGLGDQARTLLRSAGYQISEQQDPGLCCGFGGVFSALQPEIAAVMADEKLDNCRGAAPVAASTDTACLLHLQSRLLATGRSDLRLVHVAEALAEALE